MNSNAIFLDNYIGLIENLEPKYKLEIIEKISKSLRNRKQKLTKTAFGAYESEKSAEEMIEEIRENRVFNRNIEEF